MLEQPVVCWRVTLYYSADWPLNYSEISPHKRPTLIGVGLLGHSIRLVMASTTPSSYRVCIVYKRGTVANVDLCSGSDCRQNWQSARWFVFGQTRLVFFAHTALTDTALTLQKVNYCNNPTDIHKHARTHILSFSRGNHCDTQRVSGHVKITSPKTH